MLRFTFLIIAFVLELGLVSRAQPETRALDQKSVSYRIERNGQKIGTHHVMVTDLGDGRLNIDIDFKIRVKFAFVTAFKMDHEAHEIWTTDGRLLGLEALTKRKSGDYQVDVTPVPDGFNVRVNGVDEETDATLIPTSFTFPAPLFTGVEQHVLLLDTLSGNLKPSTIHPFGKREIQSGDVLLQADYYEISFDETGQITHNIWVDTDYSFIKLGLFTKDGHYIEYFRE